MMNEYAKTFREVQQRMVASGGYIWQMANCASDAPVQKRGLCPTSPHMKPYFLWTDPTDETAKSACTTWLRGACVKSAPLGKIPLMHAFSRTAGPHTPLYTKDGKLPALLQDLGSFLLTRGPYAWIGHECALHGLSHVKCFCARFRARVACAECACLCASGRDRLPTRLSRPRSAT